MWSHGSMHPRHGTWHLEETVRSNLPSNTSQCHQRPASANHDAASASVTVRMKSDTFSWPIEAIGSDGFSRLTGVTMPAKLRGSAQYNSNDARTYTTVDYRFENARWPRGPSAQGGCTFASTLSARPNSTSVSSMTCLRRGNQLNNHGNSCVPGGAAFLLRNDFEKTNHDIHKPMLRCVVPVHNVIMSTWEHGDMISSNTSNHLTHALDGTPCIPCSWNG